MRTFANLNPSRTDRSGERPGPDPAQSQVATPPSFLGPGVKIEGILELNGALVVAGRVKGRIAALKLVIAEGGIVEGDIVAREVVIAGRLDGRVFAPTVMVEASAEIEGRIFHT